MPIKTTKSAQAQVNTLDNLMPAGVRGYADVANIANKGTLKTCDPNFSNIQIGEVLRSGAGMYDAVVRTNTFQGGLACVQLCNIENESAGFGVGHAQLVNEGSAVLVYVPSVDTRIGFILGTVPRWPAGRDEKIHRHIGMVDTEPGAAQFTERAYKEPQTDPKNMRMLSANAGRPIDVLPGDLAWMTEQGIGFALLHMMAHMKASERCKIEMFMLDDLLRMVTNQYQHFSAAGEEHIYSDFGYVTRELGLSPHQCEVMGFPVYGDQFAKRLSEVSDAGKQACYEMQVPDLMMKRRMQQFMGHLGSLFQMYIQSPEPIGTASTYSAPEFNQGLAQVAADDSGRLFIRSASDIIIERYDRIPVPKKMHEPWDPQGDKIGADKDPTKKKEPFKFPTSGPGADPRAKPLLQRDYVWWSLRSLNQRFMEHSVQNGMKDWYFPEISETQVPQDLYDLITESEERYSENRKRTAQIVLRKDGGLTMREHEGAEISLMGGRVVITAPEGIEVRSGKQIIALAQDDLVMKAQRSVDITATEHDVRIKAERNLHAYSEGGILLEAAGESEDPGMEPGREGEDVQGNGIILKAKKSRIFLWAQTVHLAAIKRIFMETLEAGVGAIIQSTDYLIKCAKQIIGACGEDSVTAGYLAADGIFVGFGPTSLIVGESAWVIRGLEAGPLFTAEIDDDIYGQIISSVGGLFYDFHESTEWLVPYDPEERQDYYFTFRNPPQYDTDAPDFYVFESFWAFRERKKGQEQTWPEVPVNDTWPWPGKKHYEGAAAYQQLTQEVNIDTATDEPKNRNERTNEPGDFNPVTFNEYAG